jgi:hypothetical protein
MARRRPPVEPVPDVAMPERLARFRVEDWCDPTAEPPDWYMAALRGDVITWSLAASSTVESYWYLHARLRHMRALRAWEDEHGSAR